jgi:hypothetical protein
MEGGKHEYETNVKGMSEMIMGSKSIEKTDERHRKE